MLFFNWHLDEEKIRAFKRIHCHYFSIRKKGGEYQKENLYIENGTLFDDDVMMDNTTNEIIEKVCPLHLKHRHIKERDNENWIIPTCVKKISMINNWTNLMFQNFSDVTVEMPSIEELIVSESMKLSFRSKEF